MDSNSMTPNVFIFLITSNSIFLIIGDYEKCADVNCA